MNLNKLFVFQMLLGVLRDDYGSDRVCIPLNPRNAQISSADLDSDGTPVCRVDKTPFRFVGVYSAKSVPSA